MLRRQSCEMKNEFNLQDHLHNGQWPKYDVLAVSQAKITQTPATIILVPTDVETNA